VSTFSISNDLVGENIVKDEKKGTVRGLFVSPLTGRPIFILVDPNTKKLFTLSVEGASID
jgi:hypothetical protein